MPSQKSLDNQSQEHSSPKKGQYVHAFDSINKRQSDASNKPFNSLRYVSSDTSRVQISHRDKIAQSERERQGTPNPWYQHQKRKLLLRYQKQLLERDFKKEEEEMAQKELRLRGSIKGTRKLVTSQPTQENLQVENK